MSERALAQATESRPRGTFDVTSVFSTWRSRDSIASNEGYLNASIKPLIEYWPRHVLSAFLN
jgi:hypothetical protein